MGICPTRVGSIFTQAAGPAWDFGVHLWCVSVNETGRRNGSVKEVAYGMLPTCAIIRRRWAIYAAVPFCAFGRSSRAEDFRDGAVKKLTVSC
jgi:hypothetical protein